MTLQEQIAALPPWMRPAIEPRAHASGGGDAARYWEAQCAAAFARLTLAREWIVNAPHHAGCYAAHYRATSQTQCICGRDALLARLEPPR